MAVWENYKFQLGVSTIMPTRPKQDSDISCGYQHKLKEETYNRWRYEFTWQLHVPQILGKSVCNEVKKHFMIRHIQVRILGTQ